MQLSVKSAHTVTSRYHSIKIVRNNIMSRSADLTVEPTLAIEAIKPLLKRLTIEDEVPLGNTEGVKMFKQFCQEDQRILRSCLAQGIRHKTLRRSVRLNVAPTLTVSGLKSMLQSCPWVPKQNLVLVQHNQCPLEDDCSTLDECGVKDRNKLLVCMGGSFPISIHEFYRRRDFDIHVSSCFASIGNVKEEIYRKTGHLPEDQQLHYCKTSLDNNDHIPLVALGIVSPYLEEIFPCLSLTIPKDNKSGDWFL